MKEYFDFTPVSPQRVTAAVLGVAAIWLFAPELAQAAVTFGEMGQNVAENAKGVAKGVTMAGYAAGTTMGVFGGVECYKASKQQGGNSSYGGGITKVLIGALLLGLGELFGSGSATLFGSDQTSGMGDLGL